MVKWVVFGIVVGVGVLFVVVGFLLPSTFVVKRTVTIAAPADRIYALVADPRAWPRWSAWNKRDPQMQIEYSGPPDGAGAKWAWKSKSQGDGAMTFTAVEPGKSVAYDLYLAGAGSASSGVFRFEPHNTWTRVTWTMTGDMGTNPLYHWMGLFMNRMVGKDFDDGLAGLKAIAETP